MCSWGLSVLLCASVLAVAAKAARWSHSAYLSPDYRLLWSLGPGPQDITFELQVRTLGYVAFGFSKDGKIHGADIIVGWVDKGQVHFQDRHVKPSSSGNDISREPEVDPSQDYQLLLGYENNTHTVLRFRRRFETCDPHDLPITNDTMRVVWSFHNEEPSDGAVGSGSLPASTGLSHGSQSLYLVQRVDQETPNPEETAQIWDLKNDHVQLPLPGETLYWCKIFKLPDVQSKQHLIRYEPLIENDSTFSNVQHIILYECPNDARISRLAELNGQQCFEPEAQLFSCNAIVATWSKGSEGFSFPLEAGYPLEPTGSKYLMMETHYSVPLESELGAISVDNSGLRLYYTPELRRHDAGLLSIGIDPNWRHIIPPGQQQVVSSGHCVPACTSQAFPKAGLHVFAAVMRTHKIGRQVALRHIRGNTELPPIASDDNIDSEYQEYRKLVSPATVLPGDHLIAECVYNSSGRSSITLGGLTSREETCLVVTMYYPRQHKLTTCHSLPSLPTVLHSLGIQQLQPGSNPVKISAPPNLAGMTLEERLVTYDWDNQFESFQVATRLGSFRPICRTPHSTFLTGTDSIEAHYPNVTRPYRTRQEHCSPQMGHRTRPKDDKSRQWVSRDGPDAKATATAKSKVSRSSSTPHEELLTYGGAATLNHKSISVFVFVFVVPVVVLTFTL